MTSQKIVVYKYTCTAIVRAPTSIKEIIMKKLALLAAAAIALTLTSFTSPRTPKGANNGKIYYNTLFGISIESLVYGDGIIVNQ